MSEEKKVAVVKDQKIATKDPFEKFDPAQTVVTMENLLNKGAHFGHLKSKRHPAMNPFIWTTRNGVSIIDLEKTVEMLKDAMVFLAKVAKSNKKIVLVGTKRQARALILSAAKKGGLPYVVERWLGGTFTNFSVIRARTKFLTEGQEMMEKGEFKKYTKFERMKKQEELDRLEKKMGGIKEVTEMPGAIVVTGIKEDHLAIAEAQKMGIPVVAIADTNTDPRHCDYVVPANDDAVSSLEFFLECVLTAATAPETVLEKYTKKEAEVKKEVKKDDKKESDKKEKGVKKEA
ncbi:MAG: 30S ribosomal protein S2 [Candidatus Moranbacteria bacterium]|nr:30S ribosomal protein S2 [Candidatus Moranbacteria bacterium]